MNFNPSKKALLSIISVVLSLVLVLSIVFNLPYSNYTIIDEDDIPLASKNTVSADYYLNLTNYSTEKISYLLCHKIGSGTIYAPNKKTDVVLDNACTALICQIPDLKHIINEDQKIVWTKVYYSLSRYRVIGKIVEVPHTNSNTNEAVESDVADVVEEVKTETTQNSVTDVTPSTTLDVSIIEAPASPTYGSPASGTVVSPIEDENVIEDNRADDTKSEASVEITSPYSTVIDINSREVITMNRQQILSNIGKSYPSDTVVKWDSFRVGKRDTNDGKIPTELLDDTVYLSMNLPSESLCDYMVSAWRDNGHITGDLSNDAAVKALSMGAVYTTSNCELPDSFTVCLGKIKLFAFSKSQNKWLVIDEQPYPAGIYVYTLPWESTKATKCENVTYYPDHAEITLTRQEFEGNVLHFWGKSATINKQDYLYYACAYEVWSNDGSVSNKLTATIGIDSKNSNSTATISQLFSSRGLSVNTTHKTHWGHTIPNSEYIKNRDGDVLKSLYSH